MAGTGTQIVVDAVPIRVTNLDKVLYPATGTTKAEVIGYYQSVAPWFVPLSRRRPATRKRWPNGVGEGEAGAFFEKNLQAKSTPPWVATVDLEHGDGPKTYPLIDDAATLVWLAQLAALELHVPQWRFDADLERQNPDRLVLDLDPGDGATMEQCVELAHLLREVLDGVGFASIPVTSGSKGIHLYAPLDGTMSCDEASSFARELARSLEAMRPDLVVSDMKKAVRERKVLLDWSQNNGNKTTIAPYSLRGRAHPTVAAPRRWEELEPGVRQLEFTEVLERLAADGDPMVAAMGGGVGEPTPPVVEPVAEPNQAVDIDRPGGAAEAAADLPTYEPMLATPGTVESIHGRVWHYEVKWDGYRALARVAGGAVTWTSRRGIDLTAKYPELAEVVTLLPGHEAVLDGEIVVLDDAGRSSFEQLQGHAPGSGKAHFMAFDLLHLDGKSYVREPWTVRRAALEALIPEDGGHIHVPETLGTNRQHAHDVTIELGLEGFVAKKSDSVYQPGKRGSTWIKVKHVQFQDVVVIGWSPGTNSRAATLGSLLLAVHRDGRLVYAGRAGSGFTDSQLSEALAVLRGIETEHPPVDDVPRAEARGVHWVEPLLVGEVSFSEWTSVGRLRHPVWRGWRPDIHAEDVAL